MGKKDKKKSSKKRGKRSHEESHKTDNVKIETKNQFPPAWAERVTYLLSEMHRNESVFVQVHDSL